MANVASLVSEGRRVVSSRGCARARARASVSRFGCEVRLPVCVYPSVYPSVYPCVSPVPAPPTPRSQVDSSGPET